MTFSGSRIHGVSPMAPAQATMANLLAGSGFLQRIWNGSAEMVKCLPFLILQDFLHRFWTGLFKGDFMDLILAAVLATVNADRAVAEAIADSSCAECRKFQQSVSKSVEGCTSCGQTAQHQPIRERLGKTRSFRIRSKGGCCG